MHGLPHAIKDLEETAGIVTTSGSPLFADFVPEADSEVVRRIRARRRDRDRQDQRARVRLRLADLQRRVRPDPQPVRPHEDRRRLERRGGGGARGGPGAGRRRERLHGLPAQPGRVLQRLRLPPVARAGRLAAAPSRRSRPRSAPPVRWPAARATSPPCWPRSPARIPSCRSPSTRTRRASPRRWSRADPARLRIGWLGDLGGHLPFEPGILELCEAALARARRRGRRGRAPASIRPPRGRPPSPSATTTPPGRSSCRASASSRSCAGRPRARSRSPARRCTRRSGRGRSVAAALRALLRDHDALALPSAQVFPFDVETHWPREIAGRPMPTYHRWMEVVISASLPGCPSPACRSGSGPAGCRWACS